MIRTQIHLADAELDLLDRTARETGASRSELIRRAIRSTYGSEPRRELPSSIGIVSDGRFSSETIDDELAQVFEERWKRWHGG